MTTVRGGGILGHFTMCELAWSVAAGDAAAMPALLRQLYPQVSAYCRARAATPASRSPSRSSRPRGVPRDPRRGVVAAGTQQPFARLAYATAADTADSRFAHPGGSAGTAPSGKF